jgi:cytochrome c-type biogenesis protein CcsB
VAINETLSQYSDWAFRSAVGVYVLAMVFYLVEQAFGKVAERAATHTEMRELIAADGTTINVSETSSLEDAPVEESGSRSRTQRFGRMGASLTVLGALIQLGSIVLRGLATHRWPLGNMYEYISFITFVAVATWLVLMRRFDIRRIGAWILLPVTILMFLGGTKLYATAAPVQPALQSYWLIIHVTVISASSGLLLVPGISSLFYLFRSANETNPKRFAKLVTKIPAKDTLDRVAYRVTIFAFPFYTFGIICGAIWAESAWGRFWGWDPKETTAFVAWVIYAAYLHSRATAGFKGNRAAIINALGFATMIFNLFFINLVTTGLHSYAGLN